GHASVGGVLSVVGLKRIRPPPVVAAAIQEQEPSIIYDDHFERPFLLITKSYYARESAELIASLTMSEYMRKVTCQRQRDAEMIDWATDDRRNPVSNG